MQFHTIMIFNVMYCISKSVQANAVYICSTWLPSSPGFSHAGFLTCREKIGEPAMGTKLAYGYIVHAGTSYYSHTLALLQRGQGGATLNFVLFYYKFDVLVHIFNS